MLHDDDEHPSMVLYRSQCYQHTDFGHFIVANIFTDPQGIGRADILPIQPKNLSRALRATDAEHETEVRTQCGPPWQ